MKTNRLLILLTGIAFSLLAGCDIADDWEDGEVETPPYRPDTSYVWVPDCDNPGPYDPNNFFRADGTATIPANYLPVAGQLNFAPYPGARIYIDLPRPTDPCEFERVTVRFTLRQTNGSRASYRFRVMLADMQQIPANDPCTLDIYHPAVYGADMSPEHYRYSETSSFHTWQWDHSKEEYVEKAGAPGAALSLDSQTISIIFDSSSGVTVLQDDIIVASWHHFKNIRQVDRLYLESPDGGISWFVDDFSVEVETPYILWDNFDDQNYLTDPCWMVDSGYVSADGSQPDPDPCYQIPVTAGPIAGELNFSPRPNSRVYLDFGQDDTWMTATELGFDLHQGNGTAASYRFAFEMVQLNDDPNKIIRYREEASPEQYRYSDLSSFHSWQWDSGNQAWVPKAGAPGQRLLQTNDMQRLNMSFHPNKGVTIKQDGRVVAEWDNFLDMKRVDRVILEHMDGPDPGEPYEMSWFVDNVSIAHTILDPEVCGDPFTVYRPGDIIGITQERDCRVDLYDFEKIKDDRGLCTDPTDSQCINKLQNVLTMPQREGAIVIDGILNETDWQDSWVWHPLTVTLPPGTGDDIIGDPSYALRWDPADSRIYIAVKVRDSDHYFNATYNDVTLQDHLDIYSQGSGQGGAYGPFYPDTVNPDDPNYVVAQHFILGYDGSGANPWAVYAGLDDGGQPRAVNDSDIVDYAITVDGDWIYYEAAVTSYETFGELTVEDPGEASDTVKKELAEAVKIRFDVGVHTKYDTGTAVRQADELTTKHYVARDIRLWQLVPAGCGRWGYGISDINRDCQVNLGDVLELASDWLACTDPQDDRCDPYWKY